RSSDSSAVRIILEAPAGGRTSTCSENIASRNSIVKVVRAWLILGKNSSLVTDSIAYAKDQVAVVKIDRCQPGLRVYQTMSHRVEDELSVGNITEDRCPRPPECREAACG